MEKMAKVMVQKLLTKDDARRFHFRDFKAQSDGELFFKTTEGREDMPNFKKKIGSDEDRWLVINYIKTLKS